jgi:cysteine-rich repeat protein
MVGTMPRLLMIGVVATVACSVKPVSYTPLGDQVGAVPDAPPTSQPLPDARTTTPPPLDAPVTKQAVCGDGTIDPGEQCDDGNTLDGDTCERDCTKARCGNGILDRGEELDAPKSPSTTVPLDQATCRFDFSAMTQLFCSGSCGAWDGADDCGQGDADAFCRLKTGDPASTAKSFKVAFAAAAPGICCPVEVADVGCAQLGMFPDRGVNLTVAIDDTNLQASHGSANVVTNVVCN